LNGADQTTSTWPSPATAVTLVGATIVVGIVVTLMLWLDFADWYEALAGTFASMTQVPSPVKVTRLPLRVQPEEEVSSPNETTPPGAVATTEYVRPTVAMTGGCEVNVIDCAAKFPTTMLTLELPAR
jgi:hypothetical protein